LLLLFDAPVVLLLFLQLLAFQLFQVVMLSSLGLLVAGATAITYFTAVACMPVIPSLLLLACQLFLSFLLFLTSVPKNF
jgi:hypothetical protein